MTFPFRSEIPDFVELDLSHARNVYIFGDIHGNLKPLRRALKKVKYNPAKGDYLIGCGDWLDRGPNVLEIAQFIEETENLHWVRGNHEDMLQNAIHGCGRTSPMDLVHNGGAWIIPFIDDNEKVDQRIIDLSDRLNSAPIALEIIMPNGKHVGIVHAEISGMHWLDMRANLLSSNLQVRAQTAFEAMWERNRINAIFRVLGKNTVRGDRKCKRSDLRKAKEIAQIEYIDHVFHGHTIVGQPLRLANCSWIDTGSYKTDKVSLIDVASWIAEKAA